MPNWQNLGNVRTGSYVCYFCGNRVGPDNGYTTAEARERILICSCGRPTYFEHSGSDIRQLPCPTYENKVNHLPQDVQGLYDEARNCMAVNAFTAAAMGCRKILMHIAVDKGEKHGKTFKQYVDYLSGKYIFPENQPWVDSIRDKGNDANHQIPSLSKEDAEQLIDFTEMLLKLIYEYPGRIKTKAPPKQQRTGSFS